MLESDLVEANNIIQGVTISVQVTAENFIVKQRGQKMIISGNKDSEEIIFELTPIELGEQIIEVEFFHECARVGYVIVTTNVKSQVV
jgi:hypothetical protein